MPNTREKRSYLIDPREKLIELFETSLRCSGDICGEIGNCKNCEYDKYGANCGYAIRADHFIANGVTVQKWIPVSERLPEMWQNVLAVRTDGKFRFDFVGSLGVWYEDVNFVCYPVTHWMPLPEPPKGDEK